MSESEHVLSEEEVRWFCDAWEGRASGWSRPLTNAAAQAGWDAANERTSRGIALRGSDMLLALEEWRAHRLAPQASPSTKVEYAPPRGLPGEHTPSPRKPT